MLIWSIGLVSIALMLMVLAIEPSQLSVILSQGAGVNSHYWQWLSYILLSIAIAFALASHLLAFKHRQSLPHQTFTSKKLNALTAHRKYYLTPFHALKQQGTLTIFLKALGVAVFLLAIISNTLAQRLEMQALMPSQPMFVEAVVTPIGVSDKRLLIETASDTASKSSNNAKVTQGYRQLVTLTHMQPYDKRETAQGAKATIDTVDNPFSSRQRTITTDNLDDKAQSNLSINTKHNLPDEMTVMLSSYRADTPWLNTLAPNQQVRMRLKLRPLEVEDSANGFNEYRWLSTRHATAIAEIIDAKPSDVVLLHKLNLWQHINSYRYQLRAYFLQTHYDGQTSATPKKPNQKDATPQQTLRQDAAAVTLSLLTGDRSLISDEMTGLYRFAGISHLLAISGAHVLFLAILCASLVGMVVNRVYPQLYQVLPRWQLRFIVAVIVAFAYAMFAGFDVPAVRTAWMLIIVGVVRYLLATPSIFKVLLVLAVAMAWQDSFVLWQAGYWLSFIAVAVLIVYGQRWRYEQHPHANNLTTGQQVTNTPESTTARKIKRVVADFLKLQLWMSIALLPVSLWLFGKVSLWGFIVNVFAIGLFGWLIVPLNLLAGLVYTVSTSAADLIWSALIKLLHGFHNLLAILQTSASQVGWIHTQISLPILLLLLFMALPWMLPKGMLSRYLSLPALSVIALASFAAPSLDTQGQVVNRQKTTFITTLPTNNAQVEAVLVSNKSEDAHWLLLSAYPNKYKTNKSKENSPMFDEQQIHKLQQTLYDGIKQQDVDLLTGIIVQTVSPDMAMVVAGLRKDLPILYYWQAGLKANQTQVTAHMQGSGLTPQPCIVGKRWHSAVSDDEAVDGLTLYAITGWQNIQDDSLQDCTIQLNSHEPVAVIKAGVSDDLPVTLTPVQTVATDELTSQALVTTTVTLYSSRHVKLAKLWQLMCVDEKRGVTDTSVEDYQRTTHNHWLLSPQAMVDKSLLDTLQPESFIILSADVKANSNKTSAHLKEMQLYWQQRFMDVENRQK